MEQLIQSTPVSEQRHNTRKNCRALPGLQPSLIFWKGHKFKNSVAAMTLSSSLVAGALLILAAIAQLVPSDAEQRSSRHHQVADATMSSAPPHPGHRQEAPVPQLRPLGLRGAVAGPPPPRPAPRRASIWPYHPPPPPPPPPSLSDHRQEAPEMPLRPLGSTKPVAAPPPPRPARGPRARMRPIAPSPPPPPCSQLL
ncbi:hypothetical protein EJB05_23771, partial [Eragrostis curvula]